MMDCGCIEFLSMELRVIVRFLQHLHLSWDILLHHCSSLVNWAALLLSSSFFSHVSAASFNSADPEMAAMVHRAHGDYSKLFCGLKPWG